MKQRLLPCLLLLLLISLLAVSCSPRGSYVNPLGASYTFRGDTFRHTDARGNETSGTYSIEGDILTLTYPDGTALSLPYEKKGDTLTIGGIEYTKK